MTEITKVSGKILVIEDNADLRLMLSKILQAKNYEVVLASDGRQALDLLQEGTCPDVILLDLSMPGMSGADFLYAIKANPLCSDSRTIVVSGWDNLEARTKEMGADGFIRKPIDIDLFYKELEKQFSLRGSS